MRQRRKGAIDQLGTRQDNTRRPKVRTRLDKAPPHQDENKQMPKRRQTVRRVGREIKMSSDKTRKTPRR
jgi:hypothetical protein